MDEPLQSTSTTFSVPSSNDELSSSFKVPARKASASEPSAESSHKPGAEISKNGEQQVTSTEFEEPLWAKPVPDGIFSLEVLKNGVVVDKIALSGGKSKFLIGRLPEQCDICCEHPSCSRIHAVLQFGCKSPDTQDGFYLYDLESTHGTVVNKFRVVPFSFVNIRPGYVMKFGASTRLYILQGPDDDVDMESDLPGTMPNKVATEDRKPEKKEEDGVSWGFGEDAVDEEKEIGFLETLPAGLDEYYKEDPKKALNAFFLREGLDMEYDVEEVGHGHKKQYLCRLPLPLETPNGRQIVAEATVSGKKKEALAAAIVEACRILHSKGVLKGTTSIGKRSKGKNWADEDFYDSDEDTFLDRTGTVERKRQKRIQRSGKKDAVLETYDTLVLKLDNQRKEIAEISEKLRKAEKAKSESMGDGGLDALDTFMDAIKSGLIMDPKTKIKLKQRLTELNHDEVKLKRLIEIAKPALLPLDPISAVSKLVGPDESGNLTKETSGQATVSLGRLKTVPLLPARIFDHSKNQVFEEEVDEEKPETEPSAEATTSTLLELSSFTDLVPNDARTSSTSKRPLEKDVIPDSSSGSVSMTTQEDIPTQSSESKPYIPVVKKPKPSKRKETDVEYNASDPDYAMWIPPEDQAGDGLTDLNKRLGY